MKTVLTSLFILLTCALSAQVQYGTINYLQTDEVEVQLAGEAEFANDEIQRMISQMASSGAFDKRYVATFHPQGFTCSQQVSKPADMENESGGAVIVIESGGKAPSFYHTDVVTNRITNTEYIFDKAFLVEGTRPKLEWVLTEETVAAAEETIGLDLKVATAITEDGDTLRAGYAPSLPVQVGPLNYHGLPGAIITLRVKGKRGRAVLFRATSMSVSPEPLELEKPTEGKPIDPEKFKKENAKRIKMMQRQYRN